MAKFLMLLITFNLCFSAQCGFAFKRNQVAGKQWNTYSVSHNNEIAPQSLIKNIAIVSSAFLFLASRNQVVADDTKAFESCYSRCMFEETRPPPIGAKMERLTGDIKPRGEILRECRVKCAKSKEQLLIGKPKSSKPIESITDATIRN